MHPFALAALILTVSPYLLHAAPGPSKDPFLGKWTLDSDHSQFAPGPVPENRTMTLDMMNGGLHSLTATVGNNGGTATIEFTAKFDGGDYPVYGSDLDTVSLKRDSPTMIERTGKVRGMPSETCTMKLSPDDKTLTMTIKGSYQGTNYSSTQIYKRQ
jgi:hypothetical protein